MAINVNANTYLLSVATTSATITLQPSDVGNNSIVLVNTGADPVFVYSSAASGTAVYPGSSSTATTVGSIIPTGRHILKINPTHAYINMIRKAAATTADVAIQVGADY